MTKIINGYIYSLYGNSYRFIPDLNQDVEEQAYPLCQEDLDYIVRHKLEPKYQTRPCQATIVGGESKINFKTNK